MIKNKIGLIPRYNWDYGLSDLTGAYRGILASSLNAEDRLEKVFGQKPVLTTSGRSSLYVILKSLNLPEGSHVGVPLFCCSVVFDAIRQANLIPVFIDINLDDYNLSASDLEKKTSNLSAIVVVHMFGHPADMDSISALTDDIPLIEDCAQSLFSKYKGHYTGFMSTASFFSFRSGKYISAGEGSAIFTQVPYLRETIKKHVETLDQWSTRQELLHSTATYIKSTLYKRPWYGTLGYPIGMRIDRKLNLTAKTGFKQSKISNGDLSILNDRIETFHEKVNKQKENALYLLKNIRLENVSLPHERENCWSNYYQFVIRFQDSKQRDTMADYLFRKGIDTAKYLDEIIDVARENYNYNGDCPNAELCSKTVLVIPNHYTLSKKDLDHIINSLNSTNPSNPINSTNPSNPSNPSNPMNPTITMIKKKAFKYIAKFSPGYAFRIWLLRKCNYKIGQNVFIGEDLIIIDDLRDIQTNLIIGDRASISPRVTLVLHTKPNWSKIADYVNSRKGKINIGQDAWIGTGAVILPDVHIGEGAVVGANSVVTSDVPPYTVVGGAPARKIKNVEVPWHSHPTNIKNPNM